MVIFIQFPISDSRFLIPTDTGRILEPMWPNPDPFGEFVQSFGGVKPRTKGGVGGWIDERLICDASGAFKVRELVPFEWGNKDDTTSIKLKCSSRHLYSNGNALSKVEIVFTSNTQRVNIPTQHTRGFISNILDSKFSIESRINEKTVNLVNLNKQITEKYLSSTTYNAFSDHQINNDWVQPGAPVMVIVAGEKEHIGYPIGQRKPEIPESINLSLVHFWHKIEGKHVRIWLIKEKHGFDATTTRQLRIYLLRLHSEFESLKLVFKNIAKGIIPTQGDTDELQAYLNETIANIYAIKKKSKGQFKTDDIDRISKKYIDYFDPGFRDSVLKQLRNIRPQIYQKVAQFIDDHYDEAREKPNQIINYKTENIMGDKYEVGQAGAVGPNSSSENNTFNQIWNKNSSNIDLKELSEDLRVLSTKLRSESNGVEQDKEVLAISMAQEEAEKGNGEKVMEYLSKVGKWTLGVAKEISVGVATAAIKSATDL